MNIAGTYISCGVKQLVIGAKEKPTKEQLETIVKNAHAAIIMTSVNKKRTEVIEVLEKVGFKPGETSLAAKRNKNCFLVRHAKAGDNPKRRLGYWY